MIQLGAVAKCAPLLRPRSAQDALWEYVKSGQVTTIGSDHSPSPPEMKKDKNFFKVWGGISGGQHTLPLLITRWSAGLRPDAAGVQGSNRNGPDRRPALQCIAKITSFNV